MASWQKVMQRAARHLRDMTVSQRLAILLGAVLIAGSLAWLTQWAASPQMVPLLPQALTPSDIAKIEKGLSDLGEPFDIRGQQIYVQASANTNRLLARLHQAEQLPADTSIGFEAIIKDTNPFLPGAENDRRWAVALQNELAGVIRELNGVRDARVVLNLAGRPKGFTRNQPAASASVTIFMQGREPVPRRLGVAAAKWVVGAVRGLKRENVQVIDGGTGRVAVDWADESDASLTKLHQIRKAIEKEHEAKIRSHLDYDPNVKVSISVELNHSSEQVQDSVASEGVLTHEVRESTNSVRNQRNNQPGVQPNTGMAAAGGAKADTTVEEKTESSFQPGMRTTNSQTPPGQIKNMSAAVSISYTYLRRVFELRNPDADPPNAEDIDAIFEETRTQIAQHLARLMVPPEPEQVSVIWHYDTIAPPVTAQAESWQLSIDNAHQWAPSAALGLLAIFSLFMLARMARNSDHGESFGMEIGLSEEAIQAARRAADDLGVAQAEINAAADEDLAETHTAAVPFPFGDSAETVLDAPELDEATLQITQMLEQVSKMTESDPEGLAAVIEGWVERDS